MGIEIDLEKLDSLAIDISSFPHATLELQNKGEKFVKKIKFPTHQKAHDAMSQINAEWIKIIQRKFNEQEQIESKTQQA